MTISQEDAAFALDLLQVRLSTIACHLPPGAEKPERHDYFCNRCRLIEIFRKNGWGVYVLSESEHNGRLQAQIDALQQQLR